MKKAIFSKRDLEGSDPVSTEYMNCVRDIFYHEKVEKLSGYYQHCNTCRLQHSINVSYYSFLICKALGWDKDSAARAGLLHDLYYYDWRIKNTYRKGSHAKWHPLVAKDNARKICTLNKKEEDAIVKHMWPMTVVPPGYKESYVVCMTDKGCALFEFMLGQYKSIKKRIPFLAYR